MKSVMVEPVALRPVAARNSGATNGQVREGRGRGVAGLGHFIAILYCVNAYTTMFIPIGYALLSENSRK